MENKPASLLVVSLGMLVLGSFSYRRVADKWPAAPGEFLVVV